MQEYTSFQAIDKEIEKFLNEVTTNCFSIMKPKFVEYVEGKSLTIAFPVLEQYLNPAQRMQGGFITAAFDNVFGGLCVYETKGELIATIDISTNFERPIFLGDDLIVKVEIKSMGNTIIHLWGEARNKAGKLIATSTTNIIRMKNKKD